MPKQVNVPYEQRSADTEAMHDENRRITLLVVLAAAHTKSYTPLQFLLIVESLGLEEELEELAGDHPSLMKSLTDVRRQLAELTTLSTTQKEH